MGGLGQMDLAAIRELEALRDAFVPRPGNQRFRFHYLFLNVVDDPAQRVKPPGPLWGLARPYLCERPLACGPGNSRPVQTAQESACKGLEACSCV